MTRVSASIFVAVFVAISVLSALSRVSQAEEAPPPPTSTPAGAATDVIVAGEPAAPRLYIAGRMVLAREGTHLGRVRLSPNGRWVAVSVVPSGTETAYLAQVWVFDGNTGERVAILPGLLPSWRSDNTLLVYASEDRRILFAPDTGNWVEETGPTGQDLDWLFPQETIPSTLAMPPQYPDVIRVKHHPENTCRDVPDGQVDVIPFEEYVARAVPAEVPASWPLHALAAQAVAARTYAWYQIQVGRADYDVTDWANFQMMCDRRYPATDQAVAMTAGQYLSQAGDAQMRPIVAMYSAENGHPTLTNPWTPYLQAVPDWAGLGRPRWGHGYGLSQWGAMRRAQAGQTYRQILGHYYTGVHLQDARGGPPPAGLVGLEPGSAAPPGGLRWKSLAPYGQTDLSLVLESRLGLTRTVVVTATQPVTATQTITDEQGVAHTVTVTTTETVTMTESVTTSITLTTPQGVWLRRPLALSGDVITASLRLGETVQETVTLAVDLDSPAPPVLEAPAETHRRNITLTVRTSEEGILGLSGGWIWQGETLPWTPASAGEVVKDPQADGHAVLQARAGVHTPGVWYGPYTTGIPAPARYRAVFRLRVGPVSQGDGRAGQDLLLPDEPVARLDVADRQGTVLLGLRDIWLSDFAQAGVFQEIPVDFYLFEPPEGLEFRVAWHGRVDLALDRVELWQIQDTVQGEFPWTLGEGLTTTIRSVVFDAAGNMSLPASQDVRFNDQEPPAFLRYQGVDTWWRQLPITVSAVIQDPGWGLDVATGQAWLDDTPVSASFIQATDPWAEHRLQVVFSDLADGTYSLRFQAADRGGYQASSPPLWVKVDRTRPTIQARAVLSDGTPAPQADGWYADPVFLELLGEDETSGVRGMAYVLDGAPFVMYREPFLLDEEGWHTVRYWAQDWAGNYSRSQIVSLGIDLSPPQAQIRAFPLGRERAQLDWQVQDSLSGVASVEAQVSRDGGTWEPLAVTTSPLWIPFAGTQEMTIRLRGTDRVGHTGEWVETTVRPAAFTLYLPAVVR